MFSLRELLKRARADLNIIAVPVRVADPVLEVQVSVVVVLGRGRHLDDVL